MTMFAKQAAKYFDNAEIIELHHNQKKDAPSGTAIKTANLMAGSKSDFALNNCAETETIQGARGEKVTQIFTSILSECPDILLQEVEFLCIRSDW